MCLCLFTNRRQNAARTKVKHKSPRECVTDVLHNKETENLVTDVIYASALH